MVQKFVTTDQIKNIVDERRLGALIQQFNSKISANFVSYFSTETKYIPSL